MNLVTHGNSIHLGPVLLRLDLYRRDSVYSDVYVIKFVFRGSSRFTVNRGTRKKRG